ncbi:hypothetical protein [Liquorilactobacillus satsumensis]|nr:hypothetical protein [Liquorilactobacillus satsumensis]MCP9328112.1 hypothetical protein [Liquorilactobacillus satsumensis]
MKYLIFAVEVVLLVLWWGFTAVSVLGKIIGTVVIIGISQGMHILLKAR